MIEWYDPGSDDFIYAMGGNDVITVHNGNDTVYAGYGNDVIADAGNGNDTLFGEDGYDVFVAGSGINFLNGGLGQDTVSYEASPVGGKTGCSRIGLCYRSRVNLEETIFVFDASSCRSLDLMHAKGGVKSV